MVTLFDAFPLFSTHVVYCLFHCRGQEIICIDSVMASKRRPGFDPKSGFRNQKQDSSTGVHPAMLKQARQSGQLNLSSRGLSEGMSPHQNNLNCRF